MNSAVTTMSVSHLIYRTAWPVFLAAILLVLLPATSLVTAQDAKVPGGSAPLLRIIPDGPLSSVSSIAFSPDGKTLYAGGWDKIVHVWQLQGDSFVYSPEATFRIPIGGGLDGSITAIALSTDGQWLAIGGRGAKRSVAGSRESGFVWPGASMGPERWSDEGLIYIVHTRTRDTVELRGHHGTILDLAFAPPTEGGEQVLISAADVWKEGAYRGEITAWDVANKSPLATIDTMPVQTADGVEEQQFPDSSTIFPCRLSAIRVGNNLNQVNAGISWGDRTFAFRVWDVEKGSLTYPPAGNPLQVVNSAVSGTSEFLMPVGDGASGRGQIRRIDGKVTDRLLDIAGKSTVAFQLDPGILPTEVVSLPNRQLATVVANLQTRQSQLVLVGAEGRAAANVTLWSPMTLPPYLAGDAQGNYLAAGGNEGHEIHVFKVSELQSGTAKPQVLSTRATRFQSVNFVKSNNQHGLRIQWADGVNENGSTGILNLSSGKLQTADAELKSWTEANVSSDWKVANQVSKDNDVEFTLSGPDNQQLTFQLGCASTEVLSVGPFRTVPAGEYCPVPVLVIAVHCSGQPQLRVYNLENGDYVRRYVAHTGTIRDLAVSEEGRFVASVADDRTLCVWSLSTLKDNLGKHGLLRDGNMLLQADTEDDVVIVREGISSLPEGTRIFGTVNAETQPISQAWKLYEKVHGIEPGQEVRLDTSDGVKTVPVGQAIDEIRPLFSLFFEPLQEGKRNWIGWSPLGPYDRSGPEAETSLGWHFNTGDPDSPARFAAVDDYRDTFFTPNLLRELFTNEAIPEKKPLAAPQISILLPAEGENIILPDEFGQLMTRSPSLNAVATITGEFPADRIKSVLVTLENATGKMILESERDGADSWQITSPGGRWTRGSQRLKVQLVSDERPSRTFEERVIIRYQPEPPALKYAADQFVPKEEEFVAQFEVVPNPEVNARVSLVYEDGQGQKLGEQTWAGISGAETLKHTLKLAPGPGRITLRAVNEGASYSFESHETSVVQIPINWQPKPPSAVKVDLARVTAGEKVLPVVSGAVAEALTLNQVSVQGIAESEDPLMSVMLVANGQEVQVPGLKAGTQKSFKFEVPVVLNAGRQVISVKAITTKKVETSAELALEYLPPLPVIAADSVTPVLLPTAPGEPAPVQAGQVAMVSPWHDGTLLLTASLEALNTDASEVTPEVLVDGVPVECDLTQNNGQVSTNLVVPAGRHTVQWRLVDDRGRQGFGPSHEVSYLRPPQLLESGVAGEVQDGRLATVTARYRSPEELPILGDKVLVEINGALAAQKLVPLVEHAGGDEWTVTIPEIQLLRDGENEISMTVSNADGPALATASAQAVGRLTIPKPIITIPSMPPTNVATARINLEFFVESEEPPTTAVVSLAGRDYRVNAELLASQELVTAAGRAAKSYRFQAAVDLVSGENTIDIDVQNAGGSEKESFVVTYTPVPVTVMIDRLGTLVPQRQVDGTIKFTAPLEDSVAVLEGRLRTSLSEEQRALKNAQVWVNAFNQRTVPLEPVEGVAGEFTFKAVLTFNQKTSNTVEIVLPELAVTQNSRLARQFEVDCTNPDLTQELFVLIIGPGMHRETDRNAQKEALVRKAYTVLDARLENGKWSSNSFSKIHTPAVHLASEATFNHITSVIRTIGNYINSISARQDRTASTRAVFLVYYEGKELRFERDGQDEFRLATTNNWNNFEGSVTDNLTSSLLSDAMERIRGAHMLVLDVESVNDSAEHIWPSDPRLAVWRAPRADGIVAEQPLMTALGEVMPRTRLLTEVTRGLREVLMQNDGFVPDFQIPPALSQLTFGAAME